VRCFVLCFIHEIIWYKNKNNPLPTATLFYSFSSVIMEAAAVGVPVAGAAGSTSAYVTRITKQQTIHLKQFFHLVNIEANTPLEEKKQLCLQLQSQESFNSLQQSQIFRAMNSYTAEITMRMGVGRRFQRAEEPQVCEPPAPAARVLQRHGGRREGHELHDEAGGIPQADIKEVFQRELEVLLRPPRAEAAAPRPGASGGREGRGGGGGGAEGAQQQQQLGAQRGRQPGRGESQPELEPRPQ
jgi:hypothetical protein